MKRKSGGEHHLCSMPHPKGWHKKVLCSKERTESIFKWKSLEHRAKDRQVSNDRWSEMKMYEQKQAGSFCTCNRKIWLQTGWQMDAQGAWQNKQECAESTEFWRNFTTNHFLCSACVFVFYFCFMCAHILSAASLGSVHIQFSVSGAPDVLHKSVTADMRCHRHTNTQHYTRC